MHLFVYPKYLKKLKTIILIFKLTNVVQSLNNY